MKKFLTILQFEIANYIQNKTYMISTILIAVVIAIVMFLPRFIDMSEILGTDSGKKSESALENKKDTKEDKKDEKKLYVIYDKAGAFQDLSILDSSFGDVRWETADNESEVKNMVESQKAEAGFVVNSLTEYDYFVYNKGMMDSNTNIFESLLSASNRAAYCAQNNLNYEEVETLFHTQIQANEQVLGKDMENSYWYCYVLVIVIFMVIILYGVMIATSVTTEKSNRSIEVLVTSTSPTNLLFGKVIAGTIASILQVGIILLVTVGGYKLNQDAWGNMLDILLDIPTNVLIAFGLFGIGGFLFYAFVYGAIGALVSKTEDINKSSGSIQMIIMIVYCVVLFQMQNIDGIIMKVASFLPISSYSAMYIRVAMGEVALWEVVVSFVILVVSIIGMGLLGAKIYRMGTLRYGNPIKITAALKSIRQKSE